MNVLSQISLRDYVSKKMSIWMLILVATISFAVFAVSFVQSRQMFMKQVVSWTAIIPQQALTNLIDSDHFSIVREVRLLESTELFSSFCIMDNRYRVVAGFGMCGSSQELSAIKDAAGVVWGYYSFKADFYKFILPFLISGSIFLLLMSILYFFIRWRVKTNLEVEFSQFNKFLNNIEMLTEKIDQIYNEDEDFEPVKIILGSQITEQVVINRAISKLVDEIKRANKSLKEMISATEKKKFQDELTETALQVAHDIGSPLALLETTVQSASLELKEESRNSIRNAAVRIRDITYSLLLKARGETSSLYNNDIAEHPISSLVRQIVSEKGLEYKKNLNISIRFNCSKSCYGKFSLVQMADLNRVLSNIINNAVESFDNCVGTVIVSLMEVEEFLMINICDNGKGIPCDILAKLGEMGLTCGKKNGLGMGIYHAKTTIEAWGGRLSIASSLNDGTTVSIYLPKCKPPTWFVSSIKITNNSTVVIIDDDLSIHQLWKNRFDSIFWEQSCKVNLLHFYSPDTFEEWVTSNVSSQRNALFLCDYEFTGSQKNGIDLIRNLKLNLLSILVTSTHHLTDLISTCESHKIKLLPKDMSSSIPIVLIQIS